ncbi:MAG: hypothetical protein WBP64_19560 [Nitrososphaeraceae archaeon]
MKEAFGTQEIHRMSNPDNSIGHAAMRIGYSMVMLSDARDQWKPMPVPIYVYVNYTDATYKQAFQAGGTSVMEPADQCVNL